MDGLTSVFLCWKTRSHAYTKRSREPLDTIISRSACSRMSPTSDPGVKYCVSALKRSWQAADITIFISCNDEKVEGSTEPLLQIQPERDC